MWHHRQSSIELKWRESAECFTSIYFGLLETFDPGSGVLCFQSGVPPETRLSYTPVYSHNVFPNSLVHANVSKVFVVHYETVHLLAMSAVGVIRVNVLYDMFFSLQECCLIPS